MKRDMDLVRAVLMEIEKAPFDGGSLDISVPGHSSEEISYHILLMHEARLIEAVDLSSLDGVCWKPKRLTYEGHEFLDAARNDTFWKKAKDKVTTSTGTLTLEGLKIALSALMKHAIAGGM
jgi:hypothetical protein